ncbi:Na/Pi symporter [Aneurinibacillus sp. Ricciae_BoGa-3]|uniref:Na/Pi symporter n=1 Tax=Aneurinibacillus sp. Ricciae_BoGa-3 TaxID=3022697 RepID=UPI0023419479|nr:Na/Pi symporter [Aneurinibacillus sp. Ricciae_BoGa-3]WCK53486.1 Na/Pi symporter [Aneurinibacillus sp. Ricciae_BoGa-3]
MLIVRFCTGLLLFIGGMYIMRFGLFNLAGDRMRLWIVRFTKTPLRGLVTGTLVTMIVQSSGAVSVLTIGLTHARLISFPQTIGIILGTNIGTTFTTQLIALDLSSHAVPIFLAGSLLWFIPRPAIRAVGAALAGFGCMFLAINLLQSMAGPLQHNGWISEMLTSASRNNWIGVLIGLILTAIIQSGTATTAITMSFMNQHTIPLAMGISIVLGSNIGSCVAAVLAAIGASIPAKRVAWVHVFLNVAGVLLFMPLIEPLARVVSTMTDAPDMQIAHAQTLFNAVCSLGALPFTYSISRLAVYCVPDKK